MSIFHVAAYCYVLFVKILSKYPVHQLILKTEVAKFITTAHIFNKCNSDERRLTHSDGFEITQLPILYNNLFA